MTFGLFLPAQAEDGPVPLLWFLSGLTCTHENAMVKAGAQRWAAEAGIALVFPDTSPRGEGVANDPDFALGQGAGFYVNATQKPWAPHFRMWDYVTEELPRLLFNAFPAGRRGAGHHRPFDGRPWRADHRDELSGTVPVGLGLRADLQPDGERLGPPAIFRLSREMTRRHGRRMMPPC